MRETKVKMDKVSKQQNIVISKIKKDSTKKFMSDI